MLCDPRHVKAAQDVISPNYRVAIDRSSPDARASSPGWRNEMTTIENSGSTEMTRAKTPWIRRTVMGTAVAAVAVVTLAGATKPAQAYWYNGYWYPNYAYQPAYTYYPYGYG